MGKYEKAKIGQIYNKWKVVEFSGEKIGDSRDTYLCECTCPFHTRKIQRGIHIVSGTTKGCQHCRKLNDITNKTFDYLTIKGLDVNKTIHSLDSSSRRRTYWFAECKCGNNISVREDTLYSDAFHSCGCYLREFNDLTGMRVGKLKVTSFDKKIRYKNNNDFTTHILWHCDCDCGKRISVRQSNLLSGNSFSCGCSKRSKGEREIMLFLNNFNFLYEEQYKFDDCKDTLALPFDFAIFNKNKKLLGLIEFDGEQHYHPVSFSGSSNEALDSFQKIMYHDSIKNSYCKKKKIPLLRVSYEDLEDGNWIYLLWDFLYSLKLIVVI